MLILQMEKLGPREVKSLSAHSQGAVIHTHVWQSPTGLALWRDGPGEAERGSGGRRAVWQEGEKYSSDLSVCWGAGGSG